MVVLEREKLDKDRLVYGRCLCKHLNLTKSEACVFKRETRAQRYWYIELRAFRLGIDVQIELGQAQVVERNRERGRVA